MLSIPHISTYIYPIFMQLTVPVTHKKNYDTKTCQRVKFTKGMDLQKTKAELFTFYPRPK